MTADTEPSAPDAGPGFSRAPLTAAVCLVGALIIAVVLITARHLGDVTSARVLAVLATGTAALALLTALLAQVRSALRVLTAAALLAAVAVVLATAGALIVVSRPDGPRPSSPVLSMRLTEVQPAGQTLIVRFTFPGVAATSLVDATLTGVGYSSGGTGVLARSVVPPTDGVAVVTLTASGLDDYQNVVAKAVTTTRTCRATIDLDDTLADRPDLTCSKTR
ncbi:hypothetical protein [Actinoplanes sp. NPDC051851]|uniref:hypothetical protein n=1 Tax=Actinoplanes sp. NPDC051851 TaxID=3154753 RepID=UPI003419C386